MRVKCISPGPVWCLRRRLSSTQNGSSPWILRHYSERIFNGVPPKKICSLFLSLPFLFWDWILLLRSTRFYSYDPIKIVSVHRLTRINFFFSILISSSCSNLSSSNFHISFSLSLSSSYLLHPTSTILLPPFILQLLILNIIRHQRF